MSITPIFQSKALPQAQKFKQSMIHAGFFNGYRLQPSSKRHDAVQGISRHSIH